MQITHASKQKKMANYFRDEDFDDFHYKGSIFEGGYDYWSKNSVSITGIRKAAEELYFPESYKGVPVTALRGEPFYCHKKTYPGVRRIYIPASIEELRFTNNTFPDLEEVIISDQNSHFTTDGRMIFKNSGKTLFLCPVNGTGKLVLPSDLRRLEEYSLALTSYEEIQFPASGSLSIHEDALCHSSWIQKQAGTVVIGDYLYQSVPDEEGNLVIPDVVRRYRKNAFREWIRRTKNERYILRRIQCHALPPVFFLEELADYTSETQLVITSRKTRIDQTWLSKLKGFSQIEIPSDHKRYRSVDGVLFSRDGKCLLYYPSGRRQSSYQTPEGTVQIGAMAFADHPYLEEILMPDTVRRIGNAAFFRCKRLKKVQLSGNLRELPDYSVYTKGGVFEQCERLKEIQLPPRLHYLGTRCFYNSGLTEVILNEGLEMIGAYAFCNEKLQSICLPASLQRLGQGALYGISDIRAFAGTAKGLLSAVNACLPGEKDMRWNAFQIHVRYRKKERELLLRIPKSIKREGVYHLAQAWDHDGDVDLEEYDSCFEFVGDAEERLQMAVDGLSRVRGDTESVYYGYLKQVSLRVAQRLLTGHREEEFRIFLKEGFLSEASLGKLLKQANEEGLTASSAYLMEYIKKNGRKQRRYQL